MPPHPRYNRGLSKRSFTSDDPRSKGWFSRRQRTGVALDEYRERKERKIDTQERAQMERDKAARARSPEEQIRRLDEKGYDAKRERKKLANRISARKAAAPPTVKNKVEPKKESRKERKKNKRRS
jgi:hypothetical protein